VCCDIASSSSNPSLSVLSCNHAVPTILRLSGLRVVYPNDHRPAHVHVIGNGDEAIFELNCPDGPVSLRGNFGFAQHELTSIQKTLSEQVEQLCKAWDASTVTREEFEKTNERAKELGSRVPKAVSAKYDRHIRRIVIQLSSNLGIFFSPRDAEGLEHATSAQLAEIEISPSGYGIHFPKLDAYLYLPALLEGVFGS